MTILSFFESESSRTGTSENNGLLTTESLGWGNIDRQKGSHRVFKHPKSAEQVSLSGADGDDAKNYEEKNVGRAIENARKTK